METKINIKELAKNLKNLNTSGFPATAAITQEPTEDPKKIEAIKEEIPKKKENIQNNQSDVKPAPQKEKKATKKPEKAAAQLDMLSAALQADIELYDFTKQVWIDADIYEILVQIKRIKKVKNISILVTSIIENYINQNKDAIAQMFERKLGK